MSNNPDWEEAMYAVYGRAMSTIHGLEGDLLTLTLLVGVHSLGGTGAPGIQDLDDRLSKKTLGALLHELERGGYVDREMHEAWFRAIDVRNRLAHRFFLDRIELTANEAGRRATAKELEEIDEFLWAVQRQVRSVMPQVRQALGIDEERLQQMVAVEVHRILGTQE